MCPPLKEALSKGQMAETLWNCTKFHRFHPPVVGIVDWYRTRSKTLAIASTRLRNKTLKTVKEANRA